jgi:hypothetical protein
MKPLPVTIRLTQMNQHLRTAMFAVIAGFVFLSALPTARAEEGIALAIVYDT